jgi:hypothetical protein
MQDDLLLAILTILRIFYPVCASSLPESCGLFLDWSVLIAAYRLAAVISAALD